MNRRDILSLAPLGLALAAGTTTLTARLRHKVLFLGGRGFFGPTAVQVLLDAGHEVTLANRGQTNPHLFPGLRWIPCDRAKPDGSGLRELAGLLRHERFDWVVDTWQANPAAVAASARLLRDKVGSYQYVSSVSTYRDWARVGIDEGYPLNDTDGATVDWSSEHRYGLRKTLAELMVLEQFHGAACVLRSHGMRGYQIDEPRYEPYWPVRILRGGDVLVPEDASHYCQITDMVSLARFMVACGEQRIAGPFNVAFAPMRFNDYLQAVLRVTGSSPRIHHVPTEFLAQHDVHPYRDIPLWRPKPVGSYRFDVSAATRAGLRNRPIEELVADELAGYRARNPADDFELGRSGALSSEREAQVLAAWWSREAAAS